jgi:hypothetical protein
MKRNTDVSRIRTAEVQESAGTNTRPSSCAAAVERATVMLMHSMQESEIPIARVSEALARMAQTLTHLGAPLFGEERHTTEADVRAIHGVLAREIAVCIENLQFHDRLMQQLTQALDVMTGLAANELLARVPNVSANEASLEGSIELF